MPDGYRSLLDHHAHMTVTLEEYHKSAVDVSVLRTDRSGLHYSREIQLTRQSDGGVVLYGIVRLNLSLLAEAIQREIESESTPLGADSNSAWRLRTVKLLSLWQIETGSRLNKIFALPETKTIHGRTALIYCDSVPAIELLEIVAV